MIRELPIEKHMMPIHVRMMAKHGGIEDEQSQMEVNDSVSTLLAKRNYQQERKRRYICNAIIFRFAGTWLIFRGQSLCIILQLGASQ